MEQEIHRAALRIIASIVAENRAGASDIDLLRATAAPEEKDLDIDELANRIVERNRHLVNDHRP